MSRSTGPGNLSDALAGNANPARAAGCELDQVIGSQLLIKNTIEGYVEAGRRLRGYRGCVPDRVLMFTDNTGVRCKSTTVQHLEIPSAYVSGRDTADLKLCADDEMIDVIPAR